MTHTAPFVVLAAALLASMAHAAVHTQLPTGVEPVAYDLTITPDAKALGLKGSVKITVEVAAPTRSVTLNAADLSLIAATLDGAPATTTLDAKSETATFTASAPLAAGRHVLAIDYGGKINDRPSGLFHVDYVKARGESGRMLATQFEPADARRFLPSFDEPAKKATFAVTAVVPAADTAVSNMPAASSEALPGGMKRVRFAPTPRMSSYLLFFGAGDLERITAQADGTEIGVLVRRGDTAKARFALQAATDLLKYYNGYFGVKYPLPKLDLVGSPGESAGAMENWGAILYTQTYIMVDPKLASEADRQRVFSVIAHEMAHQWFGDLVTMAWWDNLWLNEGFASWMAAKASDHFHPEWKPLLSALAETDEAMKLDARGSTHPIVQPIETVAQAEQAFDPITYQKGRAVIRMLEAYAGEDAWRRGVRTYMARHQFGNTVSDDLWREIDAAAGKPVSAVAADFTRQPGVPLLGVVGEPGALKVTQSRFGVDAASKTPLSWRVPIGDPAAPGGQKLVSGAAPQALPAATAVLNAGQTGYYRTLYAPRPFASLAQGYGGLPAADQIGLANDAWALGFSGYAPLSHALDLSASLPMQADPVVWGSAAGRLAALDAYYDGGARRDAYRAWATGRLRPVLAQIGWEPRTGEAGNVSVLRQGLIDALSQLDDPATVTEARRRFDAYRRTPASLPAGLRDPVIAAVARHADAATFDTLMGMARTSADPLEKNKLYAFLATVEDPTLAQRMLDLAIGPEAPSNTAAKLVAAVAGGHPDLTWSFTLAHVDEIVKGAGAVARNVFVPGVAAASNDTRRADDLAAYAAANIPPDAQGGVRVAVARIRYAAEIKARRLPEIDAWLAAHPGAKT